MIKQIAPIAAVAALAAVLSGCASKPKPELSNSAPATEAAPAETPAEPAQANSTVDPVLQSAFASSAGADRVYFGFDSAELDADDRETLGRQAAWLASRPDVHARIEGHADERGTREYNLALGARRAAAARQALIAGGVAPGRITTLSYGKERPLDPASTEEAWSRNRNALTIVIGLQER